MKHFRFSYVCNHFDRHTAAVDEFASNFSRGGAITLAVLNKSVPSWRLEDGHGCLSAFFLSPPRACELYDQRAAALGKNDHTLLARSEATGRVQISGEVSGQ